MSNSVQVVNYDCNRPVAVFSLPQSAWIQEKDFESHQKFRISLKEIKFDHTTFELNNPLPIDLYKNGDLWYCSDEGHHFLACGEEMEKAVHSLQEDFAVYWRVIAESPDQDLDHDALEVKDFMHSVVKTVKTE